MYSYVKQNLSIANTLTNDQFVSRSMKQDIHQVKEIITNFKIHILDKKKKRSSHKIGTQIKFFKLLDYTKTVKCLMTYAKSNKKTTKPDVNGSSLTGQHLKPRCAGQWSKIQ